MRSYSDNIVFLISTYIYNNNITLFKKGEKIYVLINYVFLSTGKVLIFYCMLKNKDREKSFINLSTDIYWSTHKVIIGYNKRPSMSIYLRQMYIDTYFMTLLSSQDL